MTSTEEIKARLDIVDVLGEYIQLKPAGANWRARCPFHDEKTASFMVSKPKQIWHCFGCGEGGDLFTFVMKQEGLEFPEALKLLAEKAGVKIVQEAPQKKSERDRLLQVMADTAGYWAAVLMQTPQAKEARRYLSEDRGLSPETIQDWKIGYAPESWEALTTFLVKRGFTEEEIAKAGVAVRKMESHGRSAYDRFRNRIMFPIADAQGRFVGATGRILAASTTEAKYVNTPETPLYHKGKVLFGLDKAKQEIRKQNLAVIVEGNMDVIASHQVGVTNVVASSGTALTDEQVILLKRFTDRLAFAFDADAAGEAATLKGLAIALGAGFTVSLIALPQRPSGERYKDPDECARDNPDAWRQAIAHAEPVVDHYLRRAGIERDMTKLEDKQAVVRTLLPIIARLPDAVAQAHYLSKLSHLVQVPEQDLKTALRGAAPATNKQQPAPKSTAPAPADPLQGLSDRLLAGFLHDPRQAAYIIAEVPPEALSPENAALYRDMIVEYTENQAKGVSWSDESFRARLSRQPDGAALSHYDVLTLLADKEFSETPPTAFDRELLHTIARLKKNYLRLVVRRLEQDIRNVEQSGRDPDRFAALMAEVQRVTADIAKLDNADA